MRPVGQPKPGTVPKAPWERLLRHRRRSTLALTVATVAAMLLLVDNILRDQALAPVWQMAYLSGYGVMSFFMIQSFYKILKFRHTARLRRVFSIFATKVLDTVIVPCGRPL